MSVQTSLYQGELLELTLRDRELAQAGFTAETSFCIRLHRKGLVLTRLNEDTNIAAIPAELDGHDSEGADGIRIRDNSELTLAGDWLTRCGLPGQSLDIELLPGKITIRAEQGNMLA